MAQTSSTKAQEMTPVRQDAGDGAEGRGFPLWADKAPYPDKPGTYPFNWSYDFMLVAP